MSLDATLGSMPYSIASCVLLYWPLPNFSRISTACRLLSFAPGLSSGSALGDHVLGVHLGGANKEMNRVKTWWIIARMTDQVMNRERAFCQLVSNSMNKAVPLFNFHYAVPFSVGSERPNETIIVALCKGENFFQVGEMSNAYA
jgi:hypothetical protein